MTVDQAAKLRRMVKTAHARARVIAVTSGKGGVGKSTLALNLAVEASRNYTRTVLVDADLGLANLDVMCGVRVTAGLADVIAGRKRLYEVTTPTPYGFELVGGASGIALLADLADEDRMRLLAQMEILEREADLVVIDTGAGISRNVVRTAAAADEVLVVTTPEPTSITDAYAAVKLVSRCREHGAIKLVVNQAASKREAERTAARITSVSARFLSVRVEAVGWIPSDPRVSQAAKLRRPLVSAFPATPAALGIAALARRMNGPDRTAGSGFLRRLKKLLGR